MHRIVLFSGSSQPAAKPAGTTTGFSNPKILDPLAKLVGRADRITDIEVRGELAKKWSDNPRGAIATLAQLLDRAGQILQGRDAASKTQNTMNRLKQYLTYFRRENLWDWRPEARDSIISRIMDEFHSQTRRTPDSRQAAQSQGLDPSEGAWRGFVVLAHDKAKDAFLEAIAKMKAELPPEKPAEKVKVPPIIAQHFPLD